MTEYYPYSTCVGWPHPAYEEGGLSDMVSEGIDISRRAFIKNVGLENTRKLEEDLGYEAHWKRGLTMAQDWSVSYWRGKLYGYRVYYVKWSMIEHVFVPTDFKPPDSKREPEYNPFMPQGLLVVQGTQ